MTRTDQYMARGGTSRFPRTPSPGPLTRTGATRLYGRGVVVVVVVVVVVDVVVPGLVSVGF
jgi:hypothetical protein